MKCWIEKEINYLQYTYVCVQSFVTVFIAGQYKGVILTLMHHVFSLTLLDIDIKQHSLCALTELICGTCSLRLSSVN